MPEEVEFGLEEVVTLDDEDTGEAPAEEPPGESVEPAAAAVVAAPAEGSDDDTEDHIAAIEKETGKVVYGPWRERLSKAQKKRDEWREKALAQEKKLRELEELRGADRSETAREMQETLLYAQEMREQAMAAAKRLADVEAAYRETGLQSSNATLNALRGEYAQALENGDHQKAAQINTAMAQVVARQQQFQSWTPTSGEVQLPEPPAIAPRPEPSKHAVQWAEQNPWYMPGSPQHNPEKAAYATIVNNHLIASGQYDPSSPAFYQAIDFYLNQKFPAQAAPAPAPAPAPAAPARGAGISPVAPPTGAVSKSGVRTTTVTQEDRDAARIFGVDPKEIAKTRLRMGL